MLFHGAVPAVSCGPLADVSRREATTSDSLHSEGVRDGIEKMRKGHMCETLRPDEPIRESPTVRPIGATIIALLTGIPGLFQSSAGSGPSGLQLRIA